MTGFSSTNVMEARRRRLDELFAAQPALSVAVKSAPTSESQEEYVPSCDFQGNFTDSDEDLLRRLMEGRRERQESVDFTFDAASVQTVPVRLPPPPVSWTAEQPQAPVEGSIVRVTLQMDMRANPPICRVLSTNGAPVEEFLPVKPEPEVMTLPEAAGFLRFSARTVREWVRRSFLPGARIGGRLRFRRTALLEWLAEREKD